MALEIAKDNETLPDVAVSYWMREISRASKKNRGKIIEQAIQAIAEELRKLNDDKKFEYGFKTIGAIRRSFGGHK